MFNESIFRKLLQEPDPQVIRAQLRRWKEDGWHPNDPNRLCPLLVVAVSAHSVTMVAELLQHGADPDITSETVTPLMVAAVVDAPEIIALLVAAGANREAEDFRGFTALLRAAEEMHESALQELLRLGANPHHQSKSGDSALDIARQSLQECREQASVNCIETRMVDVKPVCEKRYAAIQTLLGGEVARKESNEDLVPPLPVLQAGRAKVSATGIGLRVMMSIFGACFFAIGGGCLSMPITARVIPGLDFAGWAAITNIIALVLLPIGFLVGYQVARRLSRDIP